jgi:hypothetical protein
MRADWQAHDKRKADRGGAMADLNRARTEALSQWEGGEAFENLLGQHDDGDRRRPGQVALG